MKRRDMNTKNRKVRVLSAVILTAAILASGAGLPQARAAEDEAAFFQDEDGMEEGSASKSLHRQRKASQKASGSSAAASGSNSLPGTPADAWVNTVTVSALGDLWDHWDADFSFLDGSAGVGTKEKPYEIKNKYQLMGLSQLAAMGMRVDPGEGAGEIVGSYEGAYFKLVSSIDLGGMNWNPIGFYQDTSELGGEIRRPFCGYFDGNGKTISNFRLNHGEWDNVGLFGALEDGVVENLTVKPNKTVAGKNKVSILAGSAVNSIIRDCAVSGDISASGTAGGICAEISGAPSSQSVIENCQAHVTIHAAGGSLIYVGGIAGKAEVASIVDCSVTTGDGQTARIQGRGIVGGIAGFQNDTDIYNSYVSGTIGGIGTQAAGGITGRYGSGHLKAARFEGAIGNSGLGSEGHRGAFIGTREAGDYFRYGEDVSYLFTDTMEGAAYQICGSHIPDDNEYTYAAHIGYSHKGDLYYSLMQGGISKDMTDRYFYEELEQGLLGIMDQDNHGAGKEEVGYDLDHIAPNDAGRPVRGYLITIPRIDTVSSGTNYYDAAVLEARGATGFDVVIDKEHRGAVAAGKSVTVSTSPNNTEDAKFQMDGVPTYTKAGAERDTAYAGAGIYTFTMPAENTEIKAIYKKVAVKVSVVPNTYDIRVIEERTGNRKSPVKTTKVLDNDNKLIAAYINGALAQGTQVQPVTIQAVVDANNDVADSSVRWTVDDPDLIRLERNGDEDSEGYTKKSASILVNLDAEFFTDTIRKLENVQAEQQYRYPIPDTIYGAGHQNGGVAILTASTRPAASFEEKPCTANGRINVTFQVKDKTYVAAEELTLDKTSLDFILTRRLTGSRIRPDETILAAPLQSISASFKPDFFDKKDMTWVTDEPTLITVSGEGKSAGATARADAKWIRDIIAADQGIKANDPYAALAGKGSRRGKVTAIADDMLGNRVTAECQINLHFITKDETIVKAEGVRLSPTDLTCELICTKSGNRRNPVISWTGTEVRQLTAEVFPKQAFDQTVRWQVSDDALQLDDEGNIVVNTQARWIQDADRSISHTAQHISTITAATKDGGFQAAATVKLNYKLTDQTYGSDSSSHSGSGGSGNGGAGNGGTGNGGAGGPGGSVNGPGGDGTDGNGPGSRPGETGSGENESGGNGALEAGSVTGIWTNTESGIWTFNSEGHPYADEWAFIHNPYAAENQSSADWFRFDEDGHMITGWYTDTDGKQYYLNPVSDGTRGSMVTGWHWLSGEDGKKCCHYFNPLSDGTRGSMLKDVKTPDGFTVNKNGQWIVDGLVQVQ